MVLTDRCLTARAATRRSEMECDPALEPASRGGCRGRDDGSAASSAAILARRASRPHARWSRRGAAAVALAPAKRGRLVSAAAGRPARLLEIDAGIDALARDTISDAGSWQARADAVAWLSTALALDAADRALRGGLSAPPARPLEPGAYELHVTGLDAVMLACAFPDAAGVSTGDVSVLAGAFDARSLAAVIRRVNLLGGRVLALFRAAHSPSRRP